MFKKLYFEKRRSNHGEGLSPISMSFFEGIIWQVVGRDGKTYKRASNARVNFFIVWVKSVTNSTLFCFKKELCCNLVLFWVWNLWFSIKYFFLLKKEEKKINHDINVASIVVWRSYFAHSYCQIHFTLFCRKFTFVVSYASISGNKVFAQYLLV